MRGKAGLFSRFQPFSPTLVPGLTGWWDASDSATLFDATSGGSAVAADGGVARWEDKSGNGRHWTQGTSGNRPARKTAVRNSLDVLRFDGSNDLMQANGWQADDVVSASAFTCFAVAVATSVTTDSGLGFSNQMITGDEAAWLSLFFFRSSGLVGVFATDSDFRSVTSSYSAGDWKAFSSWWSSSNEQLSLTVNGGTASTAALASLFGTANGMNLGAGGSNTRLNGDIAELIFYNVALSATDREAVESYLIDKWAIT